MPGFASKKISPSLAGGLFLRVKYAFGHFLKRKNRFRIHSPFVHRFIEHVLRPHTPDPAHLAALRQRLLNDASTLSWQDLGAGHANQGGGWVTKPVSALVRGVARGAAEGTFLMRLAAFLQPAQVLELGTHLGFSTLYLYAGHPGAKITTIEGGEAIAERAKSHFQEAGLNATVLTGDFEQVLSDLDLSALRPDLVLLDGNHRKEPTLRYFHTLLPHLPDGACVVLDDIYWSEEMAMAWEAIKQHPEVTISIDLFKIGLCFIRRNQARQEFVLRFRG